MRDTKKYLYRLVCNFALLSMAWGLFAWLWLNLLNDLKIVAYEGKGNILILIVYAIVLILSFHIMRAFQICVERIAIVVLSQMISLFVANSLESFIVMLVVADIDKVLLIVVYFVMLWVVQGVLISTITWGVTNHYVNVFPPHRILHIYGQHDNNLPRKMNSRHEKYLIADSISYSESLDIVLEKLAQYDAALLNDVPVVVRNIILKECFARNIRVYVTPKISDIILRNANELNLFDSPLYLCRNLGLTIDQKLWKRILDVVIAILLLIITSPIMVAAAVAIKMDDGGPVFFKQLRYTIDRKKFWILKFRSMIVNAEADGKANPAADNDSRITKVGHFIRATRIDELPQLINILKGEMSFVGPRAERVEHVDKYCTEIPEFEFRMKVKAGLTGYAQIYGKYNTSAYDKLKLDMIYIMSYSPLMDLQIICQTLKVIFIKESTKGFDDEQRANVQ